jgi:predicted nuclease of predicted toxin-antitoxin system
MKLLFDHNLSPRLVSRLADIFPSSNHVYNVGLEAANDYIIWQYATHNDYIIVTRDSDFSEIATIRGFPPKVIWIRVENCSTNQIENLIRGRLQAIEELNTNPTLGILILS